MARKEISRNEPCPCGSEKKYKNCCSKKGFKYVRDTDGNTYRQIPIKPEIRSVIEDFVEQREREPGFLNEELVEHEISQAMRQVGIDPSLIYAWEKTGLMVTGENRHFISDKDLAEWDSAISEYVERDSSDVTDPLDDGSAHVL